MKRKFTSLAVLLLMLLLAVGALTACFSAVNNLTLSFVVDGKKYATIETTGNESIAIPDDPEMKGYTFEGWYWDKDTWNQPFTANSLLNAPISSNMSIYAKFDAIDYALTYEADGGTHGNPASYTVEDSLTLSAAEKRGYTFLGWYSDKDYTTKVEGISAGSVGAVSLYAKFEVDTYTVSYENTKDAENSNPASYNVNTDTITLSDLSKTGYTFLGWFNGEERVTEIAGGTIGSLTLTARWELIGYEITYHNAVGAANSNPDVYDVELLPLTLLDASKAHYTFEGWYTDAAFTSKITKIAVGTTGNIDLYAKWEAIIYTATFKDGNTVIDTVEFTVEDSSLAEPTVPTHTGYTGRWESYTLDGESITVNAVYTLIPYDIVYHNTDGAENTNPDTYDVEDLPLVFADASKAHYTFLGWYSDASFTSKVTEIVAGTTGELHLYAKWEAVKYSITYNYDGDKGGFTPGAVVKAEYTVEDEFDFESLVCKKAGYTFLGWFTEKNVGTGVRLDGITEGTSGEIVLFAQFGLEEYDIVYNNVNGATNTNPGHYNVESDEFTIYPLSMAGYTFDGWFTDEDCTVAANLTVAKGSSGDIILYAGWTPIVYNIKYNTYGGTVTGNPDTYIITDNITFNSATLDGYVFKGWYTAAEGGTKVTGVTPGTTGHLELYAHWDYVSTIIFDSNGGSPVDEISNREGTAISAPASPTKEHYNFEGWYSDSALTVKYTFTAQPEEDITLYAKWTPVKYKIEYVLNGGTNSKDNVSEYTVEDKIELLAPTKVGYTFVGWHTDSEFTSAVVTEITVGTSGKVTLYAHYLINEYTISFDSNGGTLISAITQNYATNVTAPESPAKNGYIFSGWYTNSSFTSRYTFSTMPAGNITLYARWTLENYDITYNLAGGNNNSANPNSYTITSESITLLAPSKTGYDFAGWYTDAGHTQSITEIAGGSYGDIELFAKWTPKTYTITYVTPDGTVNSNIEEYTIETDLTTLTEASLTGYTFRGWYTDASYQSAVTTVAGGEIGNKTLYAKFTANTYNVWLDGNEEASCEVSFDLNGAEGSIPTQTVTPTVTLKYPTLPTREGYIFAGWYDNAAGTGSLYDFSAIVTDDITLYAKWVAVDGAAVLAINGSAGVILNGKFEQLLVFVPLTSGNVTITSSGDYDTFGVLYDEDMVMLVQNDDGGADGKSFHIVYNVTAGKTYYIGARAFSSTTVGTATVSISGNTTVADGGYAVTASKSSATYGESFALPVPEAREGYKFLGYADIDGVMYTDLNGNSVKTWDKGEDTTLHSVWERMVYTVTFNTGSGSAISPVTLAFGERLDLSLYVTTREGWYLEAWMLDNAPYEATTMPEHNITLTAKWTRFSLEAIKYDTSVNKISEYSEITPELFGANCFTTNGLSAAITVKQIIGTQAAGNSITVILEASFEGADSAVVRIENVAVYGSPTLDIDDTVDYVNIPDGLTASHFGASGTDTYGAATEIRVKIDGEYKAGDTVRIIIESVDPAGNITVRYIENVKVYSAPVISYNEDKNEISVNDTVNADLFSATAADSFGEALTVTVSLYSGTQSAGNTVTLRFTVTDSKGNTTTFDKEVKVYGAPTISAANKTDFKVEDSITPDSLGITASDTYVEPLEIALSVKSGTQSEGTVLVVTASVTDITGNTTEKDYSLKIYGAPTVTYNKDTLKVTENPTVSQNDNYLNISATDSFGEALKYDISLKSGNLAGGERVVYMITATDHLGNVTAIDTAEIPVYDEVDIELSYNQYDSDLIKLTSKGEEFSFSATDSHGNNCTLSIEAASGTLTAGELNDIYLVATDAAGNVKKSELISDIKVYDIPTVEYLGTDEFLSEETYNQGIIENLFWVEDSFGKGLTVSVEESATWQEGYGITATITARDVAGNELVYTYTFHCGTAHSYSSTVTAPTCTERGFTTHTCTCGDSYVDSYIPSLGHTHEEGAEGTVTAPTCTEEGYTTYTCSRCNEAYDTDFTAKIPHSYVEGYCTMCGKEEPRYIRVDANGNEDADGRYILFGTYPQTEVTDSTLKSTLNSLAGTKPTSANSYLWTSYGYYINGSVSNFMWYIDIDLDNNGSYDYRGVYFTSYRPYYTTYSSSIDNTYQDDNGYYTSNIYWFKYEPIEWRILTEESGKALLLCEMLIDSQEYYYSTSNRTINGKTVYANNYEYSNIRAWLNDNFYNTAFNDLQKQIIQLTTVDNSAATTDSSTNQYACANTQDYIFLPSYRDMLNTSYGFSSSASEYDTDRRKQTTDYAQCQGAYTSTNSSYLGNGWWWLRSPTYSGSTHARAVNSGGGISSNCVDTSNLGVCPALWILL